MSVGQGLSGKVSNSNRKFAGVSKSKKAEKLVLQESVQKYLMSFLSVGRMRNVQQLTGKIKEKSQLAIK